MSSKVNESRSLKDQKSLYCCTCNSQFLIKDLTLKGSRCPLLMQCGHSTCQYCLQQSLKTGKSIKCQQCSFIPILESADPTRECFSINMHLLGSMVALQNSKLEKEKRLAFLTKSYGDFDYTVKEQSNQASDANGNACEECSLTAFWYCENCQSNFCEICWTKVHESAKSLMKHCRSSIDSVETAKCGLKKCSEHKTQVLEFYCKGCSITVCSHCVIFGHQGKGHYPITLKEKNLEIISLVKTAAEEADKIVKRMRITHEKLKLTQSRSELSDRNLISELECQITRNFSRFHGLLQLEEDKLLKKLHENSNQREKSIKGLRLQLEEQIKNVECLLNEYEDVVKKPDNCDLTYLHQQLEKVQNLPCFLITKKPSEKEPKVAFDEQFMESLRLYCTLDFPPQETFELLSHSSLPENYVVEPLNVSDFEQKLPESSPSDNDTLNCSSQDLPSKGCDERIIFQEGKTYFVRVSFIKNPGEFYITLNSQRAKQEAINKKASLLASSSAAVSGTFAKDEIYLVKYNVDKKWYRGRVVEVVPPEKVESERYLIIYYIDYGNSETVPISRVRPISPDMLELSPLAVKCKLYDCVPKNGEWCQESTMMMEKILSNHTAIMFIHKIHRDYLEVDLSVVNQEGEIGKELLSVRDALFFLEFSSFVHGPKFPRIPTALHYLHQKLPSERETFDVIITHVNSPRDFYIQRIGQEPFYLYKLTIDLQNYYTENSEKGIIYNPVGGMPCAAMFSADQKWYRAKIVGIPGRKMVEVFYVDYGNTEVIPWTSIRKLRECFVKRPPLAINCELTRIGAPEDLWNDKTFLYLKNCVMIKGCRILVQGCHKSKQTLKVLLYKQTTKKEVCVNTLFVNRDFAYEIEENILRKSKSQEQMMKEEEETTTDEFKTYKKPSSDNEKQATSDLDDSLKTDGAFKKRKKNRLSASTLRKLHESEKKIWEEVSSVEGLENEADEFDNNIFKVKVKILSAESPSCIYVTFPALMEEYQNLQSKLNEFYKYFTPSTKEWTTNSLCAVFDSAKSCWYRASVHSILPEDRIKVFLKDTGRVCTVPTNALRELDPSFTKFATCAVKCHLADVKSPGKQWPEISSEFLLNELENYNEIFMTKKGQIENKSLPIELWVKKVVTRGALEPITKEWITLNELLVSQGLAVPSRLEVLCSNVLPNEEGCTDDVKESDREYWESAEEVVPIDKDIKEEKERISDALVPSLGSCWLPPEPLKKSQFVGIPTYVDYKACIYIYDVEKDEVLKMIRKVLGAEYDDSKPNVEDQSWNSGQLCIVRYHMDQSWYRGQIIQVNENSTYDVLFVDYGNVETCEVTDLRKTIKMLDVPILSRKFQLQNIFPLSEGKEGDQLPVSVVDILHSLVVDKKCEVNIFKPALDPSEPHVVCLKLIDSNVDVETFLVSQGLASYTHITSSSPDTESEVLLSLVLRSSTKSAKEDSCAFSKPSSFYIPLSIPDDCSGFFIEVTKVISETEFFSKLIDDESLPSSLKSILKEFESLQRKLTEECNSQPLVQKFFEGQPCCCVHPETNKWCRGEIERFLKDENSVSVFYVDHGSKAFLNKSLIHECKNEWLDFPRMAFKCRWANFQNSEKVSKFALTKCLNQKQLFAEVLSRQEEVLIVRLLSKKMGL